MKADTERFFYGEEARDILAKGVNLLGNMVGASLGPGGRLICIGQESLQSTVTKDGVTIAKHMKLDSPYNLGAEMIQQAAQRLLRQVGDGTTTTTILTQALVNNGFAMLYKKKLNVRILINQLNRALKESMQLLEKQRLKGGDQFDIKDVIDISTNGDEEIIDLIYQAYQEVGDHGLILVEESKGLNSFLQKTSGYQWETPMVSEQFMKDKSIDYIKLNNAKILLYDKRLEQIEPIKDILIQCSEEGIPLIVIAEDFTPEVISLFLMNCQRNILEVYPVKAPGYGTLLYHNLEDIAALTSATLITNNRGLSIRDSRWEDLGSTSSVIIRHDSITVEDPLIDKDRLLDQMAEAQLAVDLAGNHMFLDDLYKKRVARLTASAVSIMVGGVSDLDVKEKMDRYDDAIRAMQAAIKDGIVPGGGVALLRSQVQELPGDFGSTLLNKALFEVYRTILRNASIEDTSLKDMLTREKKYYRIDKDTLEISIYSSIKESRVIDPFMVVYEALRTAVSIATNILLTEGLIVRAAQVLNPNLDEIPV